MKILSNFFDYSLQLFSTEPIICLLYLTASLLVFISVAIAISRSLIETIIMMSAFSVLISLCYLLMDAPDVAMTEVALGSCLSTCVLLNFIRILKISKSTIIINNKIAPALIISILFAATLIWINSDLPKYGSSDTNLHQHLSKYYIENTKYEVGTKSLVTGLLASYRGYDTLGETSVILIAGLAMLLILSTRIYEKKPE